MQDQLLVDGEDLNRLHGGSHPLIDEVLVGNDEVATDDAATAKEVELEVLVAVSDIDLHHALKHDIYSVACLAIVEDSLANVVK